MDAGEREDIFHGDTEIYEEQALQLHFLPGYAFITCTILTKS